MKILVHVTDHHFPWHSPSAVRKSTEAITMLQPNYIVVGGDLVDCYTLSRFDKDKKGKWSDFQGELDLASRYLREIRAACPRAEIHFTEGNHEDRLNKYINRSAEAFATLRSLQISGLLPLKELRIHHYNYGAGPTIGGIMFTHGTRIRKWGGMSAREVADTFNKSVAIGHSHRLAGLTVRRGRTLIHAIESGCLCALDPPYMHAQPDWQQGFSIFFFQGPKQENMIWLPVHLTHSFQVQFLKDIAKGLADKKSPPRQKLAKMGPRRHR